MGGLDQKNITSTTSFNSVNSSKNLVQRKNEAVNQKKSVTKKMNPESEKYYVQKVTRELLKIWNNLEISDPISKLNETLSNFSMKLVLTQMGFLSKSHESQNEIWNLLGGPIKGHVTLNNLRILIFAIQNVLIQHGPSVDSSNLKPLQEGSIGMFNSLGDLFLSNQDLNRIRVTFAAIKQARREFEIKVKNERKTQKITAAQNSLKFKPEINTASQNIATRKKKESSMTTLEWLQRPALSKKWEIQVEREKILESQSVLTFKPKIGTQNETKKSSMFDTFKQDKGIDLFNLSKKKPSASMSPEKTAYLFKPDLTLTKSLKTSISLQRMNVPIEVKGTQSYIKRTQTGQIMREYEDAARAFGNHINDGGRKIMMKIQKQKKPHVSIIEPKRHQTYFPVDFQGGDEPPLNIVMNFLTQTPRMAEHKKIESSSVSLRSFNQTIV